VPKEPKVVQDIQEPKELWVQQDQVVQQETKELKVHKEL
jgi:hypothetical protein